MPHPLPPAGTMVLLSQPHMRRHPRPSASEVTVPVSHPSGCFEPDGVTSLPTGLAALLPRNTQFPACSPSKPVHGGTGESCGADLFSLKLQLGLPKEQESITTSPPAGCSGCLGVPQHSSAPCMPRVPEVLVGTVGSQDARSHLQRLCSCFQGHWSHERAFQVEQSLGNLLCICRLEVCACSLMSFIHVSVSRYYVQYLDKITLSLSRDSPTQRSTQIQQQNSVAFSGNNGSSSGYEPTPISFSIHLASTPKLFGNP